MQMILFITCILMWALAVIVTVILLMLLKDIKKVMEEQERQEEELEAVEVSLYREIKDNERLSATEKLLPVLWSENGG